MQELKYHAFISYSRKNTEIRTKLVDDLTKYGFNLWVDNTMLQPGTVDWENEIRNAIPSSACVIYLASEPARTSIFVRDELNLAERHKTTILPIWIDGEHWIDCIPLGKSYTQISADLRGENYDTGIEKFNIVLQKVIYQKIDELFREKGVVRWNGSLATILRAVEHFAETKITTTTKPYSKEFFIDFIGGEKWDIGDNNDTQNFNWGLKLLEDNLLIAIKKVAEVHALKTKEIFRVNLTELGKLILMNSEKF